MSVLVHWRSGVIQGGLSEWLLTTLCGSSNWVDSDAKLNAARAKILRMVNSSHWRTRPVAKPGDA
jgi:hypothetical protein